MTDNANGLPAEIQSQLEIIDKSQSYLQMLMASIVLTYYSVNIQRQQLICTAQDPELCKCLPDTLPLQATSSMMTIVALVYFFNLSESALKQSKTPEQCRQNQLSHLSSSLVLLAALVRFGLLAKGDQKAEVDAL